MRASPIQYELEGLGLSHEQIKKIMTRLPTSSIPLFIESWKREKHEKEAPTMVRRPKRLHFPLYSRAGEQSKRKAMLSNHLRRKLLLNDTREVCPCHTLQTDATENVMPTGRL